MYRTPCESYVCCWCVSWSSSRHHLGCTVLKMEQKGILISLSHSASTLFLTIAQFSKFWLFREDWQARHLIIQNTVEHHRSLGINISLYLISSEGEWAVVWVRKCILSFTSCSLIICPLIPLPTTLNNNWNT